MRSADPLLAGLGEQARRLQPRTVALRRALHRHPELGLTLPRTRDAVLAELADLPLQVHRGRSVSSVVAVLDGARPGSTVLLRADMDALPMHEDTGLAFASRGRRARCTRAGTTRTSRCCRRGPPAGRRRERARRAGAASCSSPARRGFHGARHMIDEGLLDRHGPGGRPTPRVRAARQRDAALRRGAHAAGPLHGGGRRAPGHGHRPGRPRLRAARRARPVPAAAAMVGALQTALTRRVDAFDPAVLTIAKIVAGTTNNVIPESAVMEGTLRTLSEPDADAAARRDPAGAPAHARSRTGARAAVEIEPGYPVTVNDDAAADWSRCVAGRRAGPNRVAAMPARSWARRTSATCCSRGPGAMVFLGARRRADPPPRRRTTATGWCSTRRRWPVGSAMYAALRWTRCGGSPSRRYHAEPARPPPDERRWDVLDGVVTVVGTLVALLVVAVGIPGSSGGADGRGTSGRSCRSASPRSRRRSWWPCSSASLEWSPDADVGMFVGVGMLAGAVGVLVTSAAIVALLPRRPAADQVSPMDAGPQHGGGLDARPRRGRTPRGPARHARATGAVQADRTTRNRGGRERHDGASCSGTTGRARRRPRGRRSDRPAAPRFHRRPPHLLDVRHPEGPPRREAVARG